MGVKDINDFIVLTFICDTPPGHMDFLCPSQCLLEETICSHSSPLSNLFLRQLNKFPFFSQYIQIPVEPTSEIWVPKLAS